MNTPLSSLSLRDLEYAVAVAHERHFGRAAERCGVSQPALSEQIRKLEGILGVTLFERTKRRVEPTPRGLAIVRTAERLLADARALLDAARDAAEPLSGELRLGVIPTLGPYYLPALIGSARAAFPKLQLRLREATTAALRAALAAGEVDAIIVALPLDDDLAVAEPLFFEPFRLACPADHPLAERSSIDVADLPRDELLLMEDGHCLRDQTLALCEGPRLDRHTRYASSLEMLRHMIAAGEGVSVVPLLAGSGDRDVRGLVAYRDFADAAAGRTIGMAWRPTETRAADLRTIAAFLREHRPAGTAPRRGGGPAAPSGSATVNALVPEVS